AALKNKKNHILVESILFKDNLIDNTILDDFTSSKNNYQALLEANNKYTQLLNQLPAGIYTCDNTGRINYFNEVASKLWGFKPKLNDDTFKYTGWYKGMTNGREFLPDISPMAMAIKKGKSYKDLEAIVEKKDGTVINICVNIDPLFDDQQNIIGAINIFQDITNQKATVKALKESENRYRNLIQGLQTPLYTTDKEG